MSVSEHAVESGGRESWVRRRGRARFGSRAPSGDRESPAGLSRQRGEHSSSRAGACCRRPLRASRLLERPSRHPRAVAASDRGVRGRPDQSGLVHRGSATGRGDFRSRDDRGHQPRGADPTAEPTSARTTWCSSARWNITPTSFPGSFSVSKRGARCVPIPIDERGELELDALERLLDSSVKVVAVGTRLECARDDQPDSRDRCQGPRRRRDPRRRRRPGCSSPASRRGRARLRLLCVFGPQGLRPPPASGSSGAATNCWLRCPRGTVVGT